MITVMFTPYNAGSREFRELQIFLENSSPPKSSGLITLPEGAIEINELNDAQDVGAGKIIRELKYRPKRGVVIDARNPDVISNTLSSLINLLGKPGFSAEELADRFFIITQSTTSNILNELVTSNNEHLKVLLEKPYYDQIMFF